MTYICTVSDGPEDGDVRLYAYSYRPESYRGRVEIFLDGSWGTIAATGTRWRSNNARVVCRQLNFRSGKLDIDTCMDRIICEVDVFYFQGHMSIIMLIMVKAVVPYTCIV